MDLEILLSILEKMELWSQNCTRTTHLEVYAIEMLGNSDGVDLTNDLSLWPYSSYVDSATNITGIRSLLTGYGLENNDGSIVSIDGDGTINYNNQSDPPSAFYGDRLFIMDTPAGRAFVIKYEYEGQNQLEETSMKIGDWEKNLDYM